VSRTRCEDRPLTDRPPVPGERDKRAEQERRGLAPPERPRHASASSRSATDVLRTSSGASACRRTRMMFALPALSCYGLAPMASRMPAPLVGSPALRRWRESLRSCRLRSQTRSIPARPARFTSSRIGSSMVYARRWARMAVWAPLCSTRTDRCATSLLSWRSRTSARAAQAAGLASAALAAAASPKCARLPAGWRVRMSSSTQTGVRRRRRTRS